MSRIDELLAGSPTLDELMDAKSDDDRRNEAAQLLIDTLPGRAAQVLLETAQQQRIHLWMLLVGLLQRAYDNGEHTAPVLDPAWLHSMPAGVQVLAPSKCEECHVTYEPRWLGQRYCSTICGVRGAKRLAALEPRTYTPLTHTVGTEPEGVPKSAMEAHGSRPSGAITDADAAVVAGA